MLYSKKKKKKIAVRVPSERKWLCTALRAKARKCETKTKGNDSSSPSFSFFLDCYVRTYDTLDTHFLYYSSMTTTTTTAGRGETKKWRREKNGKEGG